jgi:enediyne biosynthesis protein E4
MTATAASICSSAVTSNNYPSPLDYPAETNLLFHNTCKGTFEDVSAKSGISKYKGRAMGVTAADFDGDGYPDIYVANDKTENFLFHNKRDGTFEEIAVEAGAAFGQNGESTSAMGPVFFEIDNEGRTDLWVSDSKYNRLLRNNGKLGFQDVTEPAGISQLTAQYTSWGTGVYDFDNDGLKDILIFHGGLIHMVPQEHSLFRNLGGGKFEDVSTTAGSFFQTKTVGRGACFADYDNDGKVDAFLVNLGGPGQLLHNVTPSAGNWLKIRLIGTKSNRDGIGATVEVIAAGLKQRSERVAGSGYLSQDDWRLHFGLGAATKADRIVVNWPSGKRQALENVAANQVVTVKEE